MEPLGNFVTCTPLDMAFRGATPGIGDAARLRLALAHHAVCWPSDEQARGRLRALGVSLTAPYRVPLVGASSAGSNGYLCTWWESPNSGSFLSRRGEVVASDRNEFDEVRLAVLRACSPLPPVRRFDAIPPWMARFAAYEGGTRPTSMEGKSYHASISLAPKSPTGP